MLRFVPGLLRIFHFRISFIFLLLSSSLALAVFLYGLLGVNHTAGTYRVLFSRPVLDLNLAFSMLLSIPLPISRLSSLQRYYFPSFRCLFCSSVIMFSSPLSFVQRLIPFVDRGYARLSCVS